MRHHHQIALPHIGEAGQKKIAQAKVLIVGVGALGSTVAELLCRAGVQNITLCDYDIVEESNLQRQSLYVTADIGRLKVDAAKEHLIAIDPMCLVTAIAEPFSNAVHLKGLDIIIEGTDSLQARLLLNDAAKHLNKPLVVGAASRTKGMVFVVRNTVHSPDAPCFQCIVTGKTAADDCESGVVNSITHIIASMQAAAAIKELLGDPLTELVEFDIWSNEFRKISVKRNDACLACKGTYHYLEAPFSLHICASRDRLQAKPNKPRMIDLEQLKLGEIIEKEYGNALLVKIGSGTALVNKFGSIEFVNVEEKEARRFAEKILAQHF